jgi:chromosome segregation ATPase
LEALNNKLVEKEACITELKEQLESAEARASAAVARVKKVEESVAGQQAKALRDSEMHITQKDELICELRKELKSVEARATAAEVAMKNVQESRGSKG